MIDIHCHVLHEMDDGARDLQESLRLCENAAVNGISGMVLTPHCYDLLTAEELLIRRNDRMRELLLFTQEEGVPISLYAGVEAHLSDDLFYLSRDTMHALCMNHSRYLLAELPSVGMPPDVVRDYVQEITKWDLIPVMAHPERIGTFRRYPELIEELSEQGVLFQVTVGSAVGKFGEPSYRLARWMLEHRLADCLASDAHSLDWRSNSVAGPIGELSEWLPADYLESLTAEVPRQIIENEPVRKYQ
ncbi:MAG: hypothetical protein HFE85_02045 [Clostridiales bacterium]|nr:hypothetical protein [Clostridiales bacterium]